MRNIFIIATVFLAVGLTACGEQRTTQDMKDAKAVTAQQSQYAAAQPVPAFNWSLERHLVTQLYQLRNNRVATHSVWRSDHGMVEGDCASIGFGLPYDTSLTNPLVATNTSQSGTTHTYQGGALASIEQAEPNGIYASKNTAATWVMCGGESGMIEPVYVETKVTVYPYPVRVNYAANKVTRAGESSAQIKATK